MIKFKQKKEEFAEDKGRSFVGVKDEFVPDQGMDLKEILDRFTRGEEQLIGHDVNFGIDDDTSELAGVDIEKLAHADFTEKDEFGQKLRDLQARYEAQEKEKAAEQTRLSEEKRKAKEARMLQMKIKREASRIAEENKAKSA